MILCFLEHEKQALRVCVCVCVYVRMHVFSCVRLFVAP